jgi:pyruvyltransferase
MSYSSNQIFWWKPKRKLRNLYRQKLNVGDLLSVYLCDQILKSKGISLKPELTEGKRILAIGSIIHFAKDGDIVWGSGINGKISLEEITAKFLDVRSVRGPKTREVLKQKFNINSPEIYGDPGLLISGFIPCSKIKKHEVSIIPHFNQLSRKIKTKYHIIRPDIGVEEFCREISSSNFIISSSLHGIIVAESYGVPAIYWDNGNAEDIFKYEDYYLGTGRNSFKTGLTLAECIEKGGNILPIFDKETLLNSFPFDYFT